ELPGVQYEEVVYEGYGPAGVAVYVEGMTDNKNRTLPELRHLFTKYGGNLGEANCVAWMFDKKGYLVVERRGISDEEIFEQAIEAGADDIREDGENLEVLTPTDRLEAVHEALSKSGVQIAAAQIAMVPKTTVKLEGSSVKKILGMMEALEDHDDVQHVWSNFDIDPAEIRD
ncbi:MAG: YebC/PmpR family DNA-binding transcriptional regulator, partial [Acidobacteriota bacterium]